MLNRFQNNSGGTGPPPPPVPSEKSRTKQNSQLQDPDYEVIEFCNQQYSNTPPLPTKTNRECIFPISVLFQAKVKKLVPELKRHDGLHCELCGSSKPSIRCSQCNQIFCSSCDDMYHRHPKRQLHNRRVSNGFPI